MISFLGFSGGIGTVPKAVGLLLSGWVISKWKFSARTLSGWNVVLGAITFCVLLGFGNVGCPSAPIPIGGSDLKCNTDCGCTQRTTPICAKDGLTSFYSPCTAGCRNSTFNETTKTTFYFGCSCIADKWASQNMTLSDEWTRKGPAKRFDHPSLADIKVKKNLI